MLPPVHIVCENGHQGSKHRDREDAKGYLDSRPRYCEFCSSTKFTVVNC